MPDPSAAPFDAPSAARTAAGAVLALAIVSAANRAGSLAPGGAAAAVALGTTAAAAGWRWSALLIVFFLSSTGLSRWRSDEKAARTSRVVEKGGRRDAGQVLANGLAFAALAAAGAAAATGGHAFAARLLAGAAAGAIAAAAADTWATEVGTALGGTPRSLRGWRPVPAGTSGAVTGAGTAGLVAGAAAMALAAIALGMGTAPAVGALIGGIVGAWGDTAAGALVQERRWCPACALATEQPVHACGAATRVCGGLRGFGNDAVNGLCTGVGAVAGATAAYVVERLAR